MDTGEPLPRAEAIPVAEATLAGPVPGSPPRAVEPSEAQARVVLPFSKFPGLGDIDNPIMQACYAAWNEL
eukprot:14917823-Alexandrium_andersonii.AAC.1